MADIIDLSLVSAVRRHLQELLDERGTTYFLRHEGPRPLQLDPRKVERVIRLALRTRPANLPVPPTSAVDYARRELRRELIRRVVQVMLQVGL